MKKLRSFILLLLASQIILSGCNPQNGGSDSHLVADPPARAGVQELIAQQDALLARWDLEPYEAERDHFVRSASFDKYFEPVGLITLSDSVLHGNIQWIDIDDEGNLLVAEYYSRVVLYDARGNLKRVLNPEDCHPGYNHRPLRARFDRSGGIVVASNTIPAGMIYNDKGNCLHSIDLFSFNPSEIVAGLSEEVFVYSNLPDKIEIYGVTAAQEKRLIFEDDAFSEYNFRIKGINQLASVGDLHLAFSQHQNPLVSLISIETREIKEIGEVPEYYRPITRDVSPGPMTTEQLFAEFRVIGEGKSTTLGMLVLSDEILVVRHRNSYEEFSTSMRGIAWQIVHISGRVLNNEPIFMVGYETNFPGAGHGLLLRVGSSYEHEGELDSNPPILVYRYLPESE